MIKRYFDWRDSLPTVLQRKYANVMFVTAMGLLGGLVFLFVFNYLRTPVGDAAYMGMPYWLRAVVTGCLFISLMCGVFGVSSTIALVLKWPDVWGRR